MLGGCVGFGINRDGLDAEFFGCFDYAYLRILLEMARAQCT